MRTVFLDLETTGLNPEEGHRIVEIGALAYNDNEPTEAQVEQLHRYVQPDRQMDPEAEKIHGITQEKLKTAPRFAEIAQEVKEFIVGADLHAHNSSFDVGFLDAEFAQVGIDPVGKIVHKVTDTLAWAQRLFPGRSNSLDALGARAGLDIKSRRRFHGALEDAKILAEVYYFFSGGQSTLDLRATDIDPANLPDPAKIKRHMFTTSEETHRRHAEFIRHLEEISGVKQLLGE